MAKTDGASRSASASARLGPGPVLGSQPLLQHRRRQRHQVQEHQVDQMLDQAEAETDQTKRYALYESVDKTASEEAVFLAAFQGTSTWFFKPKVRGMKVVQGRIWNSLHQMYITGVQLTRGQRSDARDQRASVPSGI
ncbi:MAG: hypothetical protein U0232_28875 [Thermomicrobiales bacterium]